MLRDQTGPGSPSRSSVEPGEEGYPDISGQREKIVPCQ
jgi:hypothetical protein